MNTRITIVLVVMCAMALGGCLGELTEPTHRNPIDPENPNTSVGDPPVPKALTAVVSDRLIRLSWSVSDTAGVAEYKLYRWEVENGGGESYDLYDTTEATTYEDTDVRNGQEYSYKISAINRAGLEGRKSAAINATPKLFGVAIESGNAKTPSVDVSLQLTAPGGTELMIVSNSSGFSGAQWRPYMSSLSWRLIPGDGTKTVYTKFRDGSDNESEPVSDDIVLDTQASIESVTEDTGGEVKQSGDVIHFAVDGGEPGGSATVDVEAFVSGLVLRDDGTGGDSVADDGVYERDYVIESGIETLDAIVLGRFADDVGNEAEPLAAAGTITILDPPQAVTMYDPIPQSERALALSWSQSNELDFSSYKLYRASEPGVATSATKELLAVLGDYGETDYLDWGLEPDTDYYYVVYVFDALGQSAVSNEVTGTTEANDPPEPVHVYSPWAPDSTSLEISWTQSDEEDFMFYELFGWEQDPPNPPNSAGKRLITRTASREATFHTHASLVDTIIYWYHVAVVDSFGARAVSDSVWGSPRPPAE